MLEPTATDLSAEDTKKMLPSVYTYLESMIPRAKHRTYANAGSRLVIGRRHFEIGFRDSGVPFSHKKFGFTVEEVGKTGIVAVIQPQGSRLAPVRAAHQLEAHVNTKSPSDTQVDAWLVEAGAGPALGDRGNPLQPPRLELHGYLVRGHLGMLMVTKACVLAYQMFHVRSVEDVKEFMGLYARA